MKTAGQNNNSNKKTKSWGNITSPFPGINRNWISFHLAAMIPEHFSDLFFKQRFRSTTQDSEWNVSDWICMHTYRSALLHNHTMNHNQELWVFICNFMNHGLLLRLHTERILIPGSTFIQPSPLCTVFGTYQTYVIERLHQAAAEITFLFGVVAA